MAYYYGRLVNSIRFKEEISFSYFDEKLYLYGIERNEEKGDLVIRYKLNLK